MIHIRVPRGAGNEASVRRSVCSAVACKMQAKNINPYH